MNTRTRTTLILLALVIAALAFGATDVLGRDAEENLFYPGPLETQTVTPYPLPILSEAAPTATRRPKRTPEYTQPAPTASPTPRWWPLPTPVPPTP